MRLTPRCSAAVLASLAVLVAAAPAVAAPSPGAAGLDDRLNPGIGNGGYDVLHYDLDLRYATSDPSQSIDGDATIVARATQSLSRFNLDFAGEGVAGVWVEQEARRLRARGRGAGHHSPPPAARRQALVVRVKDFAATPTVPGDERPRRRSSPRRTGPPPRPSLTTPT